MLSWTHATDTSRYPQAHRTRNLWIFQALTRRPYKATSSGSKTRLILKSGLVNLHKRGTFS